MNQLDRIEWKLDQLLVALAKGTSQPIGTGDTTPTPEASGSHHPLPQMTTKQHAALQMLMRGASNLEIAQRFGVTENTAKVHVRSIAKKLGVNTRAQIVMKMMPVLSTADDNSYRLASGGLPLDWDETYEEPDPFVGLYGVKDGTTT